MNIKVSGKQVLSGEIYPSGSKNSAVHILAATLLFHEPVTIENIPDIKDVEKIVATLMKLGSIINWDKEKKGYFWFLVNKEILPLYKKHFGPPVWEVKHCDEFVKKWEGMRVYVENNCLYIEKEREYRNVRDLLREIKKMKFEGVEVG